MIIPNHPTTQMLVHNLTPVNSSASGANRSLAPPALRIARKLTRPQRQQKLEQHLDEQLERINENKSRLDKQTNTDYQFVHPNQSAVLRRAQHYHLHHQQSRSDPVCLSVKRSQTFNNSPGQINNHDYICRVSHKLIGFK